MAGRLTARFVATVDKPGRYSDGLTGLMLHVRAGGSKQWLQRITVQGVRRDIGLGPYPVFKLGEVRGIAAANWQIARRGGDPFEDRPRRAGLRLVPGRGSGRAAPTVAEVMETAISLYVPGQKNPELIAANWRASFERYILPVLRGKTVAEVTTADVLAIVEPLWQSKRSTGKTNLYRLGKVMAWGVAHGFRSDDPVEAARSILPKNGVHHVNRKAVQHGELAGVIERVRAGCDYRALTLAFEFLCLTACRSTEVLGGRWEEVDLEAAVWTVPGERMKSRAPPSGCRSPGPLSTVLAAAGELRDATGLVFPSLRGKTIIGAQLARVLRDLGVGMVPHGARSSFRDWATETGVEFHVAEACIAHAVGTVTTRSYASARTCSSFGSR